MVIYIVEDDMNIREIETYALKNSGFEVEGFETGLELYEQLKTRIPDLIILDIMLPQEDGLTILSTLRAKKETSHIPIMMITAKSTEIDKVKGLDGGADDYLTKPFGVMEFVSRVKALLRRANTRQEKKQEYCIGNLLLDDEKHQVMIHGIEVSLTFKEYELLKYLISNEGIVLSRDKIMERVWGFDFEGESRTVDMHIKTLRQKLKEEGSLIKTVRNVGYKIENE